VVATDLGNDFDSFRLYVCSHMGLMFDFCCVESQCWLFACGRWTRASVSCTLWRAARCRLARDTLPCTQLHGKQHHRLQILSKTPPSEYIEDHATFAVVATYATGNLGFAESAVAVARFPEPDFRREVASIESPDASNGGGIIHPRRRTRPRKAVASPRRRRHSIDGMCCCAQMRAAVIEGRCLRLLKKRRRAPRAEVVQAVLGQLQHWSLAAAEVEACIDHLCELDFIVAAAADARQLEYVP
jgi:hypothetical protein